MSAGGVPVPFVPVDKMWPVLVRGGKNISQCEPETVPGVLGCTCVLLLLEEFLVHLACL